MYYFIINPASGSGKGRIVWETIKNELEHLGVEYRHFLLRSSGEGTHLAATLSSQNTPCTIVVVGGDGTINEVVNGLTSFEHITFACIPTGSGNDFVRGLKLTRDPVKALHAILHPSEICPVNVGRIEFRRTDGNSAAANSGSSATSDFCSSTAANSGGSATSDFCSSTAANSGGSVTSDFCSSTAANSGNAACGSSTISRNFIVSSGIGFDAAVCYEVERSRLKQMLNRFHSGKLVYLLTALWQLLTMERPDFTVTIDDTQTLSCTKAYFAAVMNLPYEGGGFFFAPDSLPGDDRFDLLAVDGISRLNALCLLPLALKGKHVGHRGIHIIRCSKIKIESPSKLCIHTDGEVPGFTDQITYTLHDKKLAVIIR